MTVGKRVEVGETPFNVSNSNSKSMRKPQAAKTWDCIVGGCYTERHTTFSYFSLSLVCYLAKVKNSVDFGHCAGFFTCLNIFDGKVELWNGVPTHES